MWDTFTRSAKAAIFYAQEETIRLCRTEVEPEQVMYGLVSTHTGDAVEDTAVTRLLASMDVSRQAILEHVEDAPPLAQSEIDFRTVRLGRRSLRLIELAFAEQRRLRDGYIGTEHLLLALMQGEMLGELLSSVGLDRSLVISRLRELRSTHPHPWWQVWKRSRLEA
jgi:ATP-dependent Clp protease ATP-binding subunit ClpC